jgi:hypothetical protein
MRDKLGDSKELQTSSREKIFMVRIFSFLMVKMKTEKAELSGKKILCNPINILERKFVPPNKHFGTKVRTMVRFFVPLWSQSSQRKAFPTENFSKSKK